MQESGLAPAPDTRFRVLADELARLETIVNSWDRGPRDTTRAYRQAIDALHAEALRRLVRTLRSHREAETALREASTDEVIYAVLRHHGILKPSIAERVEEALETVRPMLAGHGGNVVLVQVDPPTLTVRFSGACDTCPASALTIDAAVKTAVQAVCPEITQIIQDRARGHGPDVSHDEEEVWFPAGMENDIPSGGIRAMDLAGRAIILARSGSVVTCFDDACVHLGAELRDGIARNGTLICPRHGFRYDLRTGDCESAPGLALLAHEARVVAGRVLVRFGG